MDAVTTHDAQQAPVKWHAVIDAARRNRLYQGQYSTRQTTRAVALKDLLDCAFDHSGTYINYRKKFIAVKICSPRVKNTAVRNAVFNMCAECKYKVVSTEQGIIIRLDRDQL